LKKKTAQKLSTASSFRPALPAETRRFGRTQVVQINI